MLISKVSMCQSNFAKLDKSSLRLYIEALSISDWKRGIRIVVQNISKLYLKLSSEQVLKRDSKFVVSVMYVRHELKFRQKFEQINKNPTTHLKLTV